MKQKRGKEIEETGKSDVQQVVDNSSLPKKRSRAGGRRQMTSPGGPEEQQTRANGAGAT
jgi:hypothetical protein